MTVPARARLRIDELPPPRRLPAAYERHTPDDDAVRDALAVLLADRDWAALTWGALVEELLALGRTDIGLGRLTEGHIDAVRTLDQAGASPVVGALYGVWASRSGATGVCAVPDGANLALAGTLKFASGAGLLDRALVPVWTDDHHHLVDLPVRDLPVDAGAWQTSAMTVSRTHTVDPSGVTVPLELVIGGPDYYLDRLGFFPGGVGVAAVWTGGLARVVDLLLGWLDTRSSPALELRLGALRVSLIAAVAVLRRGATRLDELLTPNATSRQPVDRDVLRELGTEVRSVVGAAVRTGLTEVRELAGPAGLAFATELTHAVDDLDLYVRQQNADADAALLGRTWRA